MRRSVRTNKENELKHNSSGNARPQSSQLHETLWTDPGTKSGTESSRTDLHKKIKIKTRRLGIIRKMFPPIPACEEKAITEMMKED